MHYAGMQLVFLTRFGRRLVLVREALSADKLHRRIMQIMHFQYFWVGDGGLGRPFANAQSARTASGLGDNCI